jgi:hypothetical protein
MQQERGFGRRTTLRARAREVRELNVFSGS